MKKRVVVLLIMFMMIASMAAPVFAAEERGSTIVSGTLTLYSGSGHAFLAFTNLDTISYSICGYTVHPNETISIGAFTPVRREIDGEVKTCVIRINYESNKLNSNANTYGELIAVSKDIYIQDMSSVVSLITNKIYAFDSYSLADNNCIKFALSIWNNVYPDFIPINITYYEELTDEQNRLNFKYAIMETGSYVQDALPPEWSPSYSYVRYIPV